MSIVLVGSTSGSITLQEPAVAGSTVLDLPATSGTILTSATPFSNGTGPAFSAVINTIGAGQSLSNGVFTKLTYNIEQFDTNNNYDPTTNYRFTPTVAGYYQLIARAQLDAGAGTSGEFFLDFQKNGSSQYRSTSSLCSTVNIAVSGACIIFANGSTDYFEIFGYQSSGATKVINNFGAQGNYFQAFLVRAA